MVTCVYGYMCVWLQMCKWENEVSSQITVFLMQFYVQKNDIICQSTKKTISSTLKYVTDLGRIIAQIILNKGGKPGCTFHSSCLIPGEVSVRRLWLPLLYPPRIGATFDYC